MTDHGASILRQALLLPIAERAEVIAELLASLDGEPETEVEAAWAAEIRRRMAQVSSSQVELQDWEVTRGSIQRDLDRQ